MQRATAPMEDWVHAEKVKVLARNLPFTTATGVMVALLAAFGTAPSVPMAWTWAGVFVGAALIRLAWLQLYWRSPRRDDGSRFWGYSLTFNLFVSGALWFVFGMFTFVANDSSHALFVAIIQTGLAAASLASLSAYTPALLAFAVPTMGGFILPYATSGERTSVILAAMAGVFLVVITLSGRAAERVLGQSIRLRFDNQRLIDELQAAKFGAEAASRAKSEFLAMVSHEIRTPMNGVVATAELVAQTPLDAEQQSMIGLIRHSADSLLTIINDILDFSKIEAGQLSVDDSTIALAQLMDEVAQLLAPRASEKMLELVVDVDPALSRPLRGDPAKLRQVLLNLAGNAVKFTDSGHVLLAGEPCPEGLRLRVEDSGPGIPADAQPRLFTPFTQADGGIARRYGGTGLGLSICKRLIDLMGGRITLDSVVGQGTRFTITLPLQPADASAPPPSRTRLVGARLAVAAAQPLRTALERVLTAEGATIVALDQAELVVLEGARPGVTVPIIRLVGFDAGKGAGTAASVVRKPIRAGELIEAVAVGLGRAGSKPAVPAAAAHHYQAPSRAAAEDACAVILLAEDNAINRLVIAKMLDRLGLVYDLAEDGVEGLAKMREHAYYGLVLTDFHMPKMDGITMARVIREEGLGLMPIVALTADAMPETVELCRSAGLQGHLSKPLRQAALEDIITRWLPQAVTLRNSSDATC